MSDSPVELILKRNRAFADKNFNFIFDSFHSDSNFRRQFTTREEYVAVGEATLSREFRILDCVILDHKVMDEEAQVIFLMKMEMQGVEQSYAELAWLKKEDAEWRYHRGLKVTDDELPENPEFLTFDFFSRLDYSTVF